jgi:hypothetical protein
MRLKRKIAAVLMTAALILTCMPAAAFAEGETAARPVDAYYSGALDGNPGDTVIDDLYMDGNTIDATFSDESGNTFEKTYTYGEYTYKDDNGVDQTISGFLEDGTDPAKFENYALLNVDYDIFEELHEGANDVPVIYSIPYGYDEEGYILSEEIHRTLHLWVNTEEPIEVEFIPADGFKLTGNIGYNYIDEEDFYGEGNKFEVKIEYKDDPEFVTPSVGYYTAEYEYYESEDGSVRGFYDHKNPDYERFDMEEGFECYLQKGMNEGVELTYYAYAEGLEEPKALNFKVDIDAQKYGLYTYGNIYDYTGKAIKRSKLKFDVYNTDDERVSADEYTFTTPKNKKMGWYDVELKIKDEFKDKYDTDTITSYYGIGPKAPSITKITAGKKSLTVNWKKLSSKELKNIDGMYIELSTDRQFFNNYKSVKLSKSAVKSGKKLVKGLKKGKKYYVRMYAYKTVKQDGNKFQMPSNDSKIKYKKTK